MVHSLVNFADQLVVGGPFAIIAWADAAVGETRLLEVFDQSLGGGWAVLLLVAEDFGLGVQELLP